MSKSYILGGAQTDFARNWSKEGKTFMSMFREIVNDGLAAVGMPFDEIKRLNQENRVAVYVGNFDAEQYANQGHLGAFLTEVHPAFYGVPGARYEAACASGSVAMDAAGFFKIRSGDYDVADRRRPRSHEDCGLHHRRRLPRNGSLLRKGSQGRRFSRFRSCSANSLTSSSNAPRPKSAKTASWTTLAEISRINYDNGKKNPLAQTRNWFMNEGTCQNRARRASTTCPWADV